MDKPTIDELEQLGNSINIEGNYGTHNEILDLKKKLKRVIEIIVEDSRLPKIRMGELEIVKDDKVVVKIEQQD